MKMTSSATTRVAVCRLAVALALIAVPGVARMDQAEAVHASVLPVVTAPAEVAAGASPETEATSAFDGRAWDAASVGGVNREVFDVALSAARAAVERGDAAHPSTLTVIDFSRPSTATRMWVYDLRSRALLFEEVVSHGRGSGLAMATSFSNVPESNRSSLGLYRTAETYTGKHGYSLRLDGLEPGINDRARERAIVMHAADYVNPAAAAAQGYLGRSLGCPAVRPEISRELIDTVKNGGLLFAYYPDEQWLKTSKYLP